MSNRIGPETKCMRQLQDLNLVVLKLGQMRMHLFSEDSEFGAPGCSLEERSAQGCLQRFNCVC